MEACPGLNHLYLRFGWSYLEPEEGNYDWSLIDDLMAKWAPRGLKASLRITCKETRGDDERQVFATPKWVSQRCGAKGRFVGTDQKTWLPDYGDRIFLEKLEAFLSALARRYDDAPWLEFVDVGSYGSWGEGHNYFSGEEDWPVEVVRRHARLHKRAFRNTIVMINDDHIGNRGDLTEEEKKREALRYADAGYALRDDSALVEGCAREFGYDTLRRPWMYDLFWKYRPVDMELEHYSHIRPEVFKHGFPYLEALKRSHCTYAGWHGYPQPWFSENLYFHEYAANRLGYWFFPEEIGLPEEMRPGMESFVEFAVRNNGWGKAYSAAECRLTFRHLATGREHSLSCPESDCSRWMPGETTLERYCITPGKDWEEGEYMVRVSFTDHYKGVATPVRLAMKNGLGDMSYPLARVRLGAAD